MVAIDTKWYCNFGNGTTTGYWGVAQWAAGAAYSVGQLIRPTGASTQATVTSGASALVTFKDNGGNALTHNLAAGDTVVFSSVGATGISAGTTYYVIAAGLTATAFEFSATYGGTAFTTSGAGTITATVMHVGNERVYVCTQAGTSAVSLEPVWTFTRGAIQPTDGTVKWQEITGCPSMNGDSSNTTAWSNGAAITLGQIVKNVAGTYYFICIVSHTTGGSEPTWNTTAGATTTDNTSAMWLCLGAISGFTSTWAAPHARLANAYTATWAANYSTIYVSDSHAEWQMKVITITPTLSSMAICVDHTASFPLTNTNLKTTATLTGYLVASKSISIAAPSGSEAYYYGIRFISYSTAVNALDAGAGWGIVKYEKCLFSILGAAASAIYLVSTAQYNLFLNCTFNFSAVGQYLYVTGGDQADIINATLTGTTPTNLFAGTQGPTINVRDTDLSAFGSGVTIITWNYPGSPGTVNFINCKLGSGVLFTAPSPGQFVNLINCDSGATNYRNEKYSAFGTQTTNTSVVRSGTLATDGVTPISWALVCWASTVWASPLESLPIGVFNSTIGSPINVTVYGVWNGGAGHALPTNDQIWMELHYLGSTLSPMATFDYSNTHAPLQGASNQSSDSSSWGGSVTNATAFAMTVSVTPQMAGMIYAIIKAAAPNTTFYIDPGVYIH